MSTDKRQQTNYNLAEMAGDLPDEVKIHSKSPCPDCDVDDRGNDDDGGDDDFQGCDDCVQEIDDDGGDDGIADALEDLGEALADILDENDELVDSNRLLERFTRVARRLKANSSVGDLLKARRRSLKKE